MGALGVVVIFWIVIGGIAVLVSYPESRRQRRLRKHGRVIKAVCREHLNADREDGPIRVRCGYRPDPEKGEVRAIVQTRERIPQVGEELRVVYDPEEPRRAENLDLLSKPSYGHGDVIVLAIVSGYFLVTAGCVAAYE